MNRKKIIIGLVLIGLILVICSIIMIIQKDNNKSKNAQPIEETILEGAPFSFEHKNIKDNYSFEGLAVQKENGIYKIYANVSNYNTKKDIKDKEMALDFLNKDGSILATIKGKITYVKKGSSGRFEMSTKNKNIEKAIDYRIK